MKSLTLVLLAVFSLARAEGEACFRPGLDGATLHGTCHNYHTASCVGFYTANHCPGGEENKCCTENVKCKGMSGSCADINYVTCRVPYVKNHCPGGSAVQCCPDWGFVSPGWTPGN
ncbi:hypothetical protein CPB86DRAFT_784432 [Serendipita vermifera]|nr:hypothetical protein CPB86DRAFT_784432 [Serendipita vermifera]